VTDVEKTYSSSKAPEIVQPAALSRDEARKLTDDIKCRSHELWHKLLEAYEGGAHIALGYQSWGEYFQAEFGQTGARDYQLVNARRVVRAIEGYSTIVERPNEGQARELAPLVKEDSEKAQRLWQELAEKYGNELTARHIKKAVEEVRKAEVLEQLKGEREEHLNPEASRDKGTQDRGDDIAEIFRKRAAAHSVENPHKVVSIVRASSPELVMRFNDKSTDTVPRRLLEKQGWKKCSCCRGFGVTKDGEDV
jgi:hypothetical protein